MILLCRYTDITTCPVLAVTRQRRTGDIAARPSDNIINTAWRLIRGRATASRRSGRRGDAYESVRTTTADNDCGDDGTATRDTMTAAGGSWRTECRCRVVRLRSAVVGGGDTVLLTPTTSARAPKLDAHRLDQSRRRRSSLPVSLCVRRRRHRVALCTRSRRFDDIGTYRANRINSIPLDSVL